jgi:tRNA (Thr-GGU) A37 N-methylase
MLNETPVIDIKPFVPSMDVFEVEKIGWLEDKAHKHKTTKDDGRFK